MNKESRKDKKLRKFPFPAFEIESYLKSYSIILAVKQLYSIIKLTKINTL